MGTKWVPIIDNTNRYKMGTRHWYKKWVPKQYQKCVQEIGIKWVPVMGTKWVPIIDKLNRYKIGTKIGTRNGYQNSTKNKYEKSVLNGYQKWVQNG